MGEDYQRIVNFGGEVTVDVPQPFERPIGDWLAPERPGSATALVNQVSVRTGQDVSGWRVGRLYSMLRVLAGGGDGYNS